MVVVPGGTFRMGTDTGPASERPASRSDRVSRFAVARSEVTRVAVRPVFAGETGRGADSDRA